MDSAEIDRLFAQTLVGEYEDEKAWEAVSALRRDGDRGIFERAAAWCSSPEVRKRSRGAAILCQLRRAPENELETTNPVWLFRDESYPLVADMLVNEQDPEVLSSAIAALGHLGNVEAVPLLLRYEDHSDEEVRFAVTFAHGCFPNDPRSVEGLLRLARDADDDVRHWAVFGVGVLGNADSPEIRGVLLRCLEDPNEDVREESAVGVAKRGDLRLLPKLREMLDQPEITDRVVEAATALLGLESEPSGWSTADYRSALDAKSGMEH